MSLNGQPYTKNYLTHEDLKAGATVKYRMADKPNKNRGVENADKPYSFSNEK